MKITKFLLFIVGKIIYVLMMAWMIIAMIPLFIGALMMDILLKSCGVEKTFLLLTDIIRWFEMLSVYLKTRKTPFTKENSGEKKEYV